MPNMYSSVGITIVNKDDKLAAGLDQPPDGLPGNSRQKLAPLHRQAASLPAVVHFHVCCFCRHAHGVACHGTPWHTWHPMTLMVKVAYASNIFFNCPPSNNFVSVFDHDYLYMFFCVASWQAYPLR